MYFPPSQTTTDLYTNGGEYVLSTTGEDYVGDYWALKTGQKYTGKNPQTGIPIQLNLSNDNDVFTPEIENNPFLSQVQNSKTINISPFVSLPENLANIIKPRSLPLPFSPSITENDKKQKYIIRYFTKKYNEYNYQEIKNTDFNLLEGHSKGIAWDLYDQISFLWVIDGNQSVVSKSNFQTVFSISQTQSSKYPTGKNWRGFDKLFKNYLQFYQGVKENLSTPGGKYKTSDGKEYIGLYHIHPEKGPMVGPTHIITPHDYLYLINGDIQSSPTGSTPSTIQTPTPPPSTGGGSYGGGGY